MHSRIKILIFSFLPLILLLFFGELFCRVRSYVRDKDASYLLTPLIRKEKSVEYQFQASHFFKGSPDWYYKLKPASYSPHKISGYCGRYTINSLGFRGKEFDPFNKDGKLRIFCVGESSTFCAESSDADTWPARLEYYLDKNKEDSYEVINSGFPGYYSWNYINLIRLELIKYKPDMLIIYAGINDLYGSIEKKKKIINRMADYIHALLYYRGSMFYALFSEKVKVATNSHRPINIDTIDSIGTYINNIEGIIKICKDNGIRVILVRQLLYAPNEIFARDNLTLEGVRKALEAMPSDSHGVNYSTYLEFYRHYELMESLAKLSSKYTITTLDFRGEFLKVLANDKGKLFFDMVHLTLYGNDLLAKLISGFI
ncbi:MAG: SGNH/GDSL hydrolase family protein [Candidatus Omnitrophota bacterium]|nr:SGNH/GDSL hydrolase family protein [Candidatus Omnitrophota bacterium]